MTPWNLNKADSEFSRFIRKRDGRCMNPKCICGLNYEGAPIEQLDCSHFYGRGILISRFDPENCIALGRRCHELWEQDKQGRYREFMVRHLGSERYNALVERVENYQYKNIPYLTKDGAIKSCRLFLKEKRGSSSI